MSLQQDVLDTIGANGVEREQLRSRVGNVGQNELDQVVTALMKAGRVRLNFGRYELTCAGPAGSAPPTAEQEANANLRPATRLCQDCGDEKDLEQHFSKSNLGRGYLKTCKLCVGKRANAGKQKRMSEAPETAVTIPFSTAEKRVTSQPSAQPVIADSVFDRAKAKRQAALNRMAILDVELANARAVVSRCDEFLSLYGEFAEGSG